MIRCKMNQCYYCGKDKICLNPVISIDENGMCDIFWYKGNFKPKYENINEQHMNKRKEEMVIIDAEIEEKENNKDDDISQSDS